MGANVSQGITNDIECDDWAYVDRTYQGNSDNCYDEVEERTEFASFINGIGGALMWFSLILAISSNRLE